MGCGATRPLRFAQVVPESEDLKHDQDDCQERTIDRVQEMFTQRAAQRREHLPLPNEAEATANQQQPEGELGLLLSASIVSEPKSLITWNSYDFKPSAEDYAAGAPIPPCAPTHRRYVRRMRIQLECIASTPRVFKDRVRRRRDRFEQKAQALEKAQKPDERSSPVTELQQQAIF
eukprot:TRINITY_DN5715_c1_g1_i1.p1 TRINITY_DN5715_c1_g1~~TRINITY_DN5715_c1_g1_i1.p1  ORF type:complete len:188 (+),score=34.39 TRINITY_DN5715_c1_g1_i1:42-566(+)